MTSANRGYRRHKSDYYVTPIEPIVDFLNELKVYEPTVISKDTLFLDPCAGGDSENNMSYPTAIDSIVGGRIKTIDIREDSQADTKGNYLSMNLDYEPDVIITNPPFNIARDIIEKALDDVADGGFVIMLVRLNFFGSKGRRDMWDNHMPKYSFVHSQRISFTKDGNRDSIEYQHLVWQKGLYPKETKLRIL